MRARSSHAQGSSILPDGRNLGLLPDGFFAATLSLAAQGFLAAPPLLEHALARLDERPGAGLRLGSALGDLRPATDALAPRALLEVLRP